MHPKCLTSIIVNLYFKQSWNLISINKEQFTFMLNFNLIYIVNGLAIECTHSSVIYN